MACCDGQHSGDLVPVTLLTGFLGSGKTTLLNHILSADHGKRIAVIENEFGEVGVDDALIKFQSDEDVFEMNNGCICCTVRIDLITILDKLMKRQRTPGTAKLDHIIIETTGLADPAPVAQTFFVDENVKSFSRLDGIVTMVDAKHIEAHLDEEKPEGVENEAVEQVAFADVLILNKIDLVDDEQLMQVEGRLRALNKWAPVVRCQNAQLALDAVLNLKAFDLERTLEMDPTFLDAEGEHMHDDRVTSVGFNTPGDLDLEKTNAWLGKLMQLRGTDIYRMKGVMAMQGAEEKFVFQAVHMQFSGNFIGEWGDEPRTNRLTFIGRGLDRQELTDGFMACLDVHEFITEENKDSVTLRFAVGDAVECITSAGYTPGVVVKVVHREPNHPAGRYVPYQIKLASGDHVYAPRDTDLYVRRPKTPAETE